MEYLPIYKQGDQCIRIETNTGSNKECYREGYVFTVKSQVGYYVVDHNDESHFIENVRLITSSEREYAANTQGDIRKWA